MHGYTQSSSITGKDDSLGGELGMTAAVVLRLGYISVGGGVFLEEEGYISVGGGLFLEEEGIHFSWRGCV